MKSFYKKLQALADNKGIKTKAELARFIGVSKGAIQNYEKGRIPDRLKLEAISNSFKVPVQYFYDDQAPTKIIPMAKPPEENYREALEKISKIWDWIKDDPAKRDTARDFLNMAYNHFRPNSPARKRSSKAG